jgi:hypothetical protein
MSESRSQARLNEKCLTRKEKVKNAGGAQSCKQDDQLCRHHVQGHHKVW